jgi:hypothetical protein
MTAVERDSDETPEGRSRQFSEMVGGGRPGEFGRLDSGRGLVGCHLVTAGRRHAFSGVLRWNSRTEKRIAAIRALAALAARSTIRHVRTCG